MGDSLSYLIVSCSESPSKGISAVLFEFNIDVFRESEFEKFSVQALYEHSRVFLRFKE